MENPVEQGFSTKQPCCTLERRGRRILVFRSLRLYHDEVVTLSQQEISFHLDISPRVYACSDYGIFRLPQRGRAGHATAWWRIRSSSDHPPSSHVTLEEGDEERNFGF